MNKDFVDFEGRENIVKNSMKVPFVDEVKEFNDAMGKSWQNRTKPTIDEKDAAFVVEFIQEELDELKEAIKNKDIVEILDAIADITYVCLGNGVMSFGLRDKFLAAYAEVQRSNMSKLCRTEDIAKQTVKAMEEKNGEPYIYSKIDNHYVVYRERDMKVGKSIEYSAPDLKQFFTEEEIENCKK